jgi:hypothetical protein
MYESLRKHSSCDITLHVLALDEDCARTLRTLNLPGIEVDVNIFRPKQGQTHREFCWSMASRYSDWLLNSPFNLMQDLTYLDADLFFFSDPEKVFDGLGKCSIGITPHRLIPSKRHLEVNGRYNVGWVTFLDTRSGRSCLAQWANRVREKCSETEGCGDQLYLNDWPTDYPGEVCELGIGVNVAPWNVANWELTSNEGIVYLATPRLGDYEYDCVPIVCYHFHEYIHGERLTNYELRDEDRRRIYAPYVEAVNQSIGRVASAKLELQWETA